MQSEYPVMKNPVSEGKVLNFNNGCQKYLVIESDGVCYGEKGYTLLCECISSQFKAMIGELYSFDDRVFREYNGNNIVVEEASSDQLAQSIHRKISVDVH